VTWPTFPCILTCWPGWDDRQSTVNKEMTDGSISMWELLWDVSLPRPTVEICLVGRRRLTTRNLTVRWHKMWEPTIPKDSAKRELVLNSSCVELRPLFHLQSLGLVSLGRWNRKWSLSWKSSPFKIEWLPTAKTTSHLFLLSLCHWQWINRLMMWHKKGRDVSYDAQWSRTRVKWPPLHHHNLNDLSPPVLLHN
jgi:hypothetical protein